MARGVNKVQVRLPLGSCALLKRPYHLSQTEQRFFGVSALAGLLNISRAGMKA